MKELTVLIDDKISSELANINSANLLNEEDMVQLTEMLPELQHNVRTQTIWRTETEIRVSVLNEKDFPDNSSKYHQAKLEQMVFFEQLLDLSFEYKKLQKKIQLIECEIEEMKYELEDDTDSLHNRKLYIKMELKDIDKKQMIYTLQNMQIQARERMRELKIWSKIKKELDDNSFDIDNKDTNQLLSLTKKYTIEAWNLMNSKIPDTDIASLNNIANLFTTMINKCIECKMINEILEYFGMESNVSKWLITKFNIKI